MGGPADGEGAILADPLGVAEVDEGDSSRCADHEVGGLHVPIDEPVGVQLLEDEAHLHDDQPREALVELASHLEQLVQRQAHHWLQDHVQPLLVLEGMDEPVDSPASPLGEVPQRFLLVDDMLCALAVLEGASLDGLTTSARTLHTTNLWPSLPR